MIDLLLQLVIILVALVAAAFLANASETLAAYVAFGSILFVLVGYPTIFEAALAGTHAGQGGGRPARRVRRGRSGRLVGIVDACDRGLVEIYLTLGASSAITASFLSPRAQRLGDLMAGTFVVSEPAALLRLQPVVFPTPPGHAEYVDVLDVARLGSRATEWCGRRCCALAPSIRPPGTPSPTSSGTGWWPSWRWCAHLDDRRGIPRRRLHRLSAPPRGPGRRRPGRLRIDQQLVGCAKRASLVARRPICGGARSWGVGCLMEATNETPLHYLDHAATTPLLPEAIEAMAEMTHGGLWANPSGGHLLAPGQGGRRRANELAELFGAALGGGVHLRRNRSGQPGRVGLGRRRRTCGAQRCCARRSSTRRCACRPVGSGIEVAVDGHGLLDLDALAKACTPDVALVSVILVNNEVGTIANLDAIAEVVRRHAPTAWLHTDAVQAHQWVDVACGPQCRPGVGGRPQVWRSQGHRAADRPQRG